MGARQTKQLRQAREAVYREVVLATAERLFGSSGYAGTKMADIARAAGISLATLYAVFPGKDSLYDAITSERGGRLLEHTVEQVRELAADGGAHPIAVMLNGMGVYLRFFMSHPDYLRMILFDGYVWWHSSASPSPEQEALWEQGKQFLMAAFAWGVESGVFVEGSPEEMARTLTALQQTRLANWVLSDMTAPEAVVISRAQAELVRVFCPPRLAGRLLTVDGSRLADGVLADNRRLWDRCREALVMEEEE